MSGGFNPPPNPLPLGMGGTGTQVGPTCPVTTVSGLPSPSGRTGQIIMVTDALAPAIGVTVAGSGAVTVVVVSTGSAWVVI